MQILISTSSFGKVSREPLTLLEQMGARVVVNPYGRTLTRDEAKELLKDVDAVIAGTEKLDREVLTSAPSLRMVSRVGMGVDNVDLNAAQELGIRVSTTPTAHVDGVAELTLAGLLDLLRGIAHADRDIRAGKWTKPMGRLLKGKTVGLIGFGRVSQRLAELLAPFQTRILGVDPVLSAEQVRERGAELVDLATLIKESDIVSLHIPYTAANQNIISREVIAQMKPGAFLVNTARGGLVDEAALFDALSNGALGGAYLDTFAQEPYTGPLRELTNVVLTSHVGSYAAESRVQMETEAVQNVLKFFELEARS